MPWKINFFNSSGFYSASNCESFLIFCPQKFSTICYSLNPKWKFANFFLLKRESDCTTRISYSFIFKIFTLDFTFLLWINIIIWNLTNLGVSCKLRNLETRNFSVDSPFQFITKRNFLNSRRFRSTVTLKGLLSRPIGFSSFSFNFEIIIKGPFFFVIQRKSNDPLVVINFSFRSKLFMKYLILIIWI